MLIGTWFAIGLAAAVLFGLIVREREQEKREENERIIRELMETSALCMEQAD